MTSLIDSVLALEDQADRILADARKAAENASHGAAQEIDRRRDAIESETEARIQAQRAHIEAKLAEDLTQSESSHHASIARLDHAAAQVIPRQAARIVQAFLED